MVILNIETDIRQCLSTALEQQFALKWADAAHIEPCKHPAEGEFTTNIAFLLAKQAATLPITLAETLVNKSVLPATVASMHATRPGFINIRVSNCYMRQVLDQILAQKSRYGADADDTNERILLEFVSVNPTGPLHIGHARGAAFGDSLARLLRFVGKDVTTEYYVNDAGRQIDILLLSVYLRTLDAPETHFPAHAYKGEYISCMATQFAQEFGALLSSLTPPKLLYDADAMNEESSVDVLIAWLSQSLAPADITAMRTWIVEDILRGIRADLADFAVDFDSWFYESSVYQKGILQTSIKQLNCYAQEGALWLATSEHGDDKDRVIQRKDGDYTYFATDIAYHQNKFERGFTHLINVWGADHHGYVARMKAAVMMLDHQQEQLECILMQLVSLIQSGKKQSMSTRSGTFAALADLVQGVGKDACRFHLVRHSAKQAMDFDVDIALAKSRENPVFYVQYAHARICALQNKIGNVTAAYDDYQFTTNIEKRLISHLGHWPRLVATAANSHQPHMITLYLEQLAERFHVFYMECKIQGEEQHVQQGRYAICLAAKEVLVLGLQLLGVSAPKRM